MIAGMPDDRPLQFATTELLTIPESNVLNAALAFVRGRRAALGPFFDTFLATLTHTDPDLARLLRAAATLDRDRKTDKVLREQHYRRTRPAKAPGPRNANPFLADPVTRG